MNFAEPPLADDLATWLSVDGAGLFMGLGCFNGLRTSSWRESLTGIVRRRVFVPRFRTLDRAGPPPGQVVAARASFAFHVHSEAEVFAVTIG